MAVQPPRKNIPAAEAKVKDIDDRIAREHGKKPSLNQKERAELQAQRRDKPVARKPGRIADSPSDHEGEHVAEKEGGEIQLPHSLPEQQQRKKGKLAGKKKPTRAHEGRDRRSQEEDEQKPEPEVFSLGRLAAEQRVDMARTRGFQQTPDVSDYVLARQEVSTGLGYAEALQHVHASSTATEDSDVEPEEFLSAFESMKDIYVKAHGRASPKTAQLLESPDLEDMIQMLQELHQTDELRRSAEARIKGSIHRILKDEPGPLLLGLNDERLLEPWQLFLSGWDIWIPDVESEVDDAEGSGVELFWEGEAENAAGDEIEITQTLSFDSNRIKLSTQFGDETDELTFDGQTFFRLAKR